MLKIRLTRKGKKNSAFFRVVVAEHTSPIKGKFLENLGFLNPHTKEKEFKADRIKYWIEKGAQCSDTVHNLLVSNSIISGPKKVVKIKKKPEVAVPAEAPASPADKPASEGEKKPEETTEAKPENKEAEKPAEIVEPKKEEKEVEDAKPEAEKKESASSTSPADKSVGEEKKSDEKK